jgi:hypothetical protein
MTTDGSTNRSLCGPVHTRGDEVVKEEGETSAVLVSVAPTLLDGGALGDTELEGVTAELGVG